MKPLLKPRSHSNLYHATMRSPSSGLPSRNPITRLDLRDRIVAWYKLEWERGLSSGFTENYSPRSPTSFFLMVFHSDLINNKADIFRHHLDSEVSCRIFFLQAQFARSSISGNYNFTHFPKCAYIVQYLSTRKNCRGKLHADTARTRALRWHRKLAGSF